MDSNEVEGVCYAQPVTLEDRVQIVRDFVDRCGYEIPIAIDPVSNPADELYAAWPERFYIVGDDGTIAYKGKTGPFGFHPEEVAAWLLQRFPPQVLPPGEVGAERIAGERLRLRAIEYARSRPEWKIEVDSAGATTVDQKNEVGSLVLDPERLRLLRQGIADASFFSWREASGEPVVDGRVRTISITLGTTFKIVHLYDPAPASPDVERFEKLWSLLRDVEP